MVICQRYETENGQGRSLTRGTGLPSPLEMLQEECQRYPLAQQKIVIKSPFPRIRLYVVDHNYDLKVSYTEGLATQHTLHDYSTRFKLQITYKQIPHELE